MANVGAAGHEFGTVTGRKRRCGWFDAVLVRQTCATVGVSGIALTKLDVLDGFAGLKICVGYDLDGQRLDYSADRRRSAGALQADLRRDGRLAIRPPGRSWAELPGAAIKMCGGSRN